jgi:hypothetical protein
MAVVVAEFIHGLLFVLFYLIARVWDLILWA